MLSPDIPRNPYYHLHALREPTMFFGRRLTLTLLYEAITNKQCLSLIGTRCIGKSSVLECARLPEVQQQYGFDAIKHIFILLDLRNYNQKTRADFFTSLNQQLITQTQKHFVLTAPEGMEQDIFSAYLEQIKDQGFHAVLLMDAFDHVTRNTEFDWNFFGFLKALVNRTEVSYITASIKPLAEVCHSDIVGSPFFTIFTTHTLGPLTEEEAHELITIPSSRAESPFTAEEVGWVLAMAGRHPMFLQQACRMLFDGKREQGNKEVNRRDLLRQVYEQLLPYFAYTWDTLEEERLDLLEREARRKLVRNRAIPELSESALFRRFVRSKAQVTLATLTIEDVKDAIEHLDDTHYLGESQLSFLNVVHQKLQDRTTSASVIERGMVVRDILQTAVKRMKPSGAQRDAAIEWRLYNILFYLYFVEHLTRAQLAARLGMTKRHLHREQIRAIEALLDILLEMERASIDDLDV
jgi:hypothetical protein